MLLTPFVFQIVLAQERIHHTESTTLALSLQKFPRTVVGYEQDFHRPVYPVDRVDPLKFFSKSDVERAKQRMHGWVEVLARTGR